MTTEVNWNGNNGMIRRAPRVTLVLPISKIRLGYCYGSYGDHSIYCTRLAPRYGLFLALDVIVIVIHHLLSSIRYAQSRQLRALG
jgi:hypothetical protein